MSCRLIKGSGSSDTVDSLPPTQDNVSSLTFVRREPLSLRERLDIKLVKEGFRLFERMGTLMNRAEDATHRTFYKVPKNVSAAWIIGEPDEFEKICFSYNRGDEKYVQFLSYRVWMPPVQWLQVPEKHFFVVRARAEDYLENRMPQPYCISWRGMSVLDLATMAQAEIFKPIAERLPSLPLRWPGQKGKSLKHDKREL